MACIYIHTYTHNYIYIIFFCLQVTRKLTEETAEEFVALYKFIYNRSDTMFTKAAQVKHYYRYEVTRLGDVCSPNCATVNSGYCGPRKKNQIAE